jgi:hypothetical protein
MLSQIFIKVRENDILLSNDKGKEIIFNIDDKSFLYVLRRNIEKFGDEKGCRVSLETKTIDEQYIILHRKNVNSKIKIKTPPIIINEIMPRMILLNKTKYPSAHIEQQD